METLGDKIISILKADLPGQLAAIQASYKASDEARESTGKIELVLEPVPDGNYVFGPVRVTSKKPPFVAVTGVEVKYDDRVNFDRSGFHSASRGFIVEAFISADHAERGARMIQRYGKAIAEVIRGNSRLDGLASAGIVKSIKFGILEAKRALFPAVKLEVEYKAIAEAI